MPQSYLTETHCILQAFYELCVFLSKYDLPFVPQILALHAFRRFENKSDAINLTTRQIGGRLTGLLWDYCLPGELIIVGRPEYKSIIEGKLVCLTV
uniref:Uncharacterized protein n=1 Tax=Hordeum vulgare subsp. vulgare TaxID=112509 RepID=A0A8I6Y953_HORVV